MNVGIVGCGNISDIYFQNCKLFDALRVVACADLVVERAKEKASKFGIPKALTTEQVIADPDVELVINLTIPRVHFELAQRLVDAGKHVYNEKPLSTVRADARRLIENARARKLRVGCAPDTFMGAGLQTCRQVVDAGTIGRPVAATAFMMSHGPEGWHPDPEFFYKPGGGPLFDMGPYYLTAMVHLLGPVQRVSATSRVSFAERQVGHGPKAGQRIKVETPTHITGMLEFANGAVGTLIFSFDVWAHQMPHIEVHGTEGSLSLPDPNFFGGPVRVFTPGDRTWREVPLSHGYDQNSRALGVADMAYAIRSGRPHRASGDLAFHVLDIMESMIDASRTGLPVDVKSRCERPAPMQAALPFGTLDE